jgi:hypothetical protein
MRLTWLELCNYLNITKKSVVKLLNHILKNKNFNSFLFLFYQLFRKITSVYNFDKLKEKLIFYKLCRYLQITALNRFVSHNNSKEQLDILSMFLAIRIHDVT